jgi:hypothetical protein
MRNRMSIVHGGKRNGKFSRWRRPWLSRHLQRMVMKGGPRGVRDAPAVGDWTDSVPAT